MTSLRLHWQRRVVSDRCNKIFSSVATQPRQCRWCVGEVRESWAIFYLGYHSEINNRCRVIPSMALYITTIDTYNTSHISSFIQSSCVDVRARQSDWPKWHNSPSIKWELSHPKRRVGPIAFCRKQRRLQRFSLVSYHTWMLSASLSKQYSDAGQECGIGSYT